MRNGPPRDPIPAGLALAGLAAVAFGVTTPVIRQLGAGVGPFATACLLYLGAALGAVPLGRRGRDPAEARVRWRHLPRIAVVAVLGAAAAPSLLAWGLQRVPASYGSLLLNGEAVFTVGLAVVLLREPIGARVVLAVLLMLLGGAATMAGGAGTGPMALAGMAAVLGAVFAWALDNVLTRPLADLDPAAVVRIKALLGAMLTASLALLGGEPSPGVEPFAGLLLCGATGYGASLRLYLRAQRRIGAARTGSVFAAAPFVGSLVAVLIGDGAPSLAMAIAALLFAAGAALHLSERHAHEHTHRVLEHDHAHRHDDGHHEHSHGAQAPGSHAHPHNHPGMVHAHPHAPDLHHAHDHDPEPTRPEVQEETHAATHRS